MLALLLAAMVWAIGPRNRRGVSRWRSVILPLAAGLLLTLALAGCGAGGGGGGGGTTPNPGTPVGTSTLTVTDTFHSQSAGGYIDHPKITGGVGTFHKESAAVPAVKTTPFFAINPRERCNSTNFLERNLGRGICGLQLYERGGLNATQAMRISDNSATRALYKWAAGKLALTPQAPVLAFGYSAT